MQQFNFTTLIVIVTVVTSFAAWNNPTMASKWVFNASMVKNRRQYHRFLSSGFIHSTELPFGYFHLAFNMIALHSFGGSIEYLFTHPQVYGRELGLAIYLGLYLLGVIVSSIPSYFKHKNNPGYNSLGASGGVAAVVFASILFNPTGHIRLLFIPIGFSSLVLGIVYLIYSYVQARKGAGRIGHDAHFTGAVFGILYTIAVFPTVIDLFINQLSNWDFSIIKV